MRGWVILESGALRRLSLWRSMTGLHRIVRVWVIRVGIVGCLDLTLGRISIRMLHWWLLLGWWVMHWLAKVLGWWLIVSRTWRRLVVAWSRRRLVVAWLTLGLTVCWLRVIWMLGRRLTIGRSKILWLAIRILTWRWALGLWSLRLSEWIRGLTLWPHCRVSKLIDICHDWSKFKTFSYGFGFFPTNLWYSVT